MPAKYKDIVAACLESGNLYEDEDFPARQSSVYYNKSGDNIVWKRPAEIVDNPKFSVDGATKHDLDQGHLGNCWFLAAAATLSTQQDLFERVVPLDQSFDDGYCGAFRFNFWRYGDWQEVVIDDRLPTVDGQLYFCHNKETPNEFWSALMEKAYAKIHGSYQALEAGLGHDALVDFTGGISEEIDLKDLPEVGRTKLFIRLKRLAKRNSLLCAAIYNDDQNTGEVVLSSGLVAGHAYSITDMMKVTLKNDKKARLVRIRNPWGRNEWNGSWSDGSDKWEELDDEERKKISTVTLDDGEFWMTFNDMVDNFHAIQICHLTDTPRKQRAGKKGWQTLSYHGEWIKGVSAGGAGNDQNMYFTNPQYYCILTDPDEEDEEEQCTLIVSLMQKHARLRKTLEKQDKTEKAIGFDLFRYKGETPEELDGFTATKRALRLEKKELNYKFVREMSVRFDVEPGTYCVLPNTFNVGDESEFLLRFATERKIKSGEVGNENDVSVKPKSNKQRKIDMLFEKYAGEDNVVDARELRQILNEGLMQNKDEDFSKETCREIIQSITGERRGLLDKSDCKMAWRKVKTSQQVFNEYDEDSSGTLDAKELRNAFQSLGFKLGRKAQGNIVKKYCDKRNHLSLDDFICVTTKMSNSKEMFRTMRRKKQRAAGDDVDGEAAEEEAAAAGVEVTCDEFMELNL